MKGKLLLAVVGVGAFVLYLSGCAKQSVDRLEQGPACDTTNVKYSTQIVPILEINCYRCHQGPGAVSSIDFSNYKAFQGWALSGYVVGDITSAPSIPGIPAFTPMPYGGPPLSSCEINTIIAWINQGAQNN
jgi:hypothetical protein